MESDEFNNYYDIRNIKKRKYLKYNNKCGYSRKHSPKCSFCHPKRNNNTGIIDFKFLFIKLIKFTLFVNYFIK